MAQANPTQLQDWLARTGTSWLYLSALQYLLLEKIKSRSIPRQELSIKKINQKKNMNFWSMRKLYSKEVGTGTNLGSSEVLWLEE
jgi:hypothetical protein